MLVATSGWDHQHRHGHIMHGVDPADQSPGHLHIRKQQEVHKEPQDWYMRKAEPWPVVEALN